MNTSTIDSASRVAGVAKAASSECLTSSDPKVEPLLDSLKRGLCVPLVLDRISPVGLAITSTDLGDGDRHRSNLVGFDEGGTLRVTAFSDGGSRRDSNCRLVL